MRKEPLAVSLALHLSAVAAITLLVRLHDAAALTRKPTTAPQFRITKLTLPPRLAPPAKRSSDPGGGNRNPLPASKGTPPPRPTSRVFIPPQLPPPTRAKLEIASALEDAPPTLKGQLLGDSNGRVGGPPSLGPGIRGIGGNGDLGLGDGPGGPGPRGVAAPVFKKPTKWPELLFKHEPEYSEQARKVRQQGTVILAVEVSADGRPQNIRVLRGLGVGLDEKAIEAVSSWRFKPAISNGRPVAAGITIEVNFRLL